MKFLHKECMGIARRQVWLRKQLHQFWIENLLCFSRREGNPFNMCTRPLPSPLVLQVPWDVVGEKKPCCLVGDHETQVDVQIVVIHDHTNYFMLYVTHKKKSTTLPVSRKEPDTTTDPSPLNSSVSVSPHAAPCRSPPFLPLLMRP